MIEILPRIFLGDLTAAKNTDKLKKLEINHILTIDTHPLPSRFTNDFHYKFICAQDSITQNLLSFFDECYEFIDKGSENVDGNFNSILIHCSTILIAYIMKKEKITADESYLKVLAKKNVCPNNGFLHQLKLYERLGCVLNSNDRSFRAYRLNQFAKNMIETYSFFDTNDFSHLLFGTDPLHNLKTESVETSTQIYKCRQCRRDLFYDTSVLYHTKGLGYLKFKYDDISPPDTGQQSEDEKICKQFLFIEPVTWMRDQISQISGKLHCPKCQAKIGTYNWSGEVCGCKTWITPSFNIQNAKIDRSTIS